ncbi:unnamed protein product [Brassica rapa subsp. trilocularis]
MFSLSLASIKISISFLLVYLIQRICSDSFPPKLVLSRLIFVGKSTSGSTKDRLSGGLSNLCVIIWRSKIPNILCRREAKEYCSGYVQIK